MEALKGEMFRRISVSIVCIYDLFFVCLSEHGFYKSIKVYKNFTIRNRKEMKE